MTSTPPVSTFSGKAFFQLAIPMIISRAGLAAMGIADGIMVARYQSHEFAWLSLAEGTSGRLLDIFIAFLIGSLSLVPRHMARGDEAGARIIWQRTLPVALLLGVVGLLVSLAGNPLLTLAGQQPELSVGAGSVMRYLGLGYPAALLAISAAVYLEGSKHPNLVAVSVIAANAMNIVVNWVLIGGHWGFAAMGARGSAISTTLVRCGLCVALVSFAWHVRSNKLSTYSEADLVERTTSRHLQWRLGWGSASVVGAMVVLTSSLTIFAGWLGVLPLAIFSAAWGFAGPISLVSLGMSDATGISVSAQAGIADATPGPAAVAWRCMGLTVLCIAALACVLAIWPHAFAAIYSKEAGMSDAIAAVLPLVALILVIDSAGFLMAASLRALREVMWPAGIEISSMLLLVPAALALAFGLRQGIRGLLLAMLLSAIARTGLLMWRFSWRTSQAGQNVDAAHREWVFNAK